MEVNGSYRIIDGTEFKPHDGFQSIFMVGHLEPPLNIYGL